STKPEYEPKSLNKGSTKPEYEPKSLNKGSTRPEYEPKSLNKGSTRPEYEPKSINKGSTRPEYEPYSVQSSVLAENDNSSGVNLQNKQQSSDESEEVNSPPDVYVPKPLSTENIVKEYIPKPVYLPTSNVDGEDEYSPRPIGLDKPTPEYIPSGIWESHSRTTLAVERDEEYVPLPPKNLPLASNQSTDSEGEISSTSPQMDKDFQSSPPVGSLSSSMPVSTSVVPSSCPAAVTGPYTLPTHTADKITPGFYREQGSNDGNRGNQSQKSGKGGAPSKSQRQAPSKNEAGKQKTKPPKPGSSQGSSKTLMYVPPPPTYDTIVSTLGCYNIPEVAHPPAFCSKPGDVPAKPVEVGGQVLKLKSRVTSDLEDFEGRFQEDGLYNWRLLLSTLSSEANVPASRQSSILDNREKTKYCVLTPVKPPPSPEEVIKWTKARKILEAIKKDRDGKDEDDGGPPSSWKGQKNITCGSKGHASKTSATTPSQDKGTHRDSSGGQSRSRSAGSAGDHLLKTSTPQPKKHSTLDVLHLTPIGRVASPGATEDGTTPVSSSRPRRSGTKRRVSWEGEESRAKISPVISKKRRASYEGLAPLDEESEDEPTPERKLYSKRRVSFEGLALKPSAAAEGEEAPSGSRAADEQEDPEGPTRKKLKEKDPETAPPPPPASTSGGHIGYGEKNRPKPSEITKDDDDSYVDATQPLPSPVTLSLTSRQRRLPPTPADEHPVPTAVPELLPRPEVVFAGAILVSNGRCDLVTRTGMTDLSVLHVDDETSLLEETVGLVQMSSWGYVLERGVALGLEMVSRLSRVPEGTASHHDEELDEYGADQTSQIHMTGRIVLNVWRLMRSEVTLLSYTLDNVAYHVLHTRVPSFSHDTLRQWWTQDTTRWRTLEHYLNRCHYTIDLLHRLDLIHRTAELARLFGIQFYDVLSRGTQYRVESMMLRLARGSNMVSISPSIQQRGAMKAPEWIALTMEPQSRFYTDPVVVLDFQSLYPSIMIAYNYCYSTCLGRVNLVDSPQPIEFGATYLHLNPKEIAECVDEMNVSPCGVAFVPRRVRHGVLPRMLEEILNTRLMVKRMMKVYKNDSSLQRVLHSRQLGLKLIANVTYGYTSANFSGRMPCPEIGDSVVSKGRETLERSIQLVNSHPSWDAKVVYGDTDSLFVHLPGRTKEQAFKIGYEIAHQVTQMYPKPIKLRFEKVYLPCILQTKKRYVGHMYETADQTEPEFDAKGIETVRRDGCPAVSKILEKSLRLLFESKDVSQVKAYVQRQFLKLLQGRATLQDLTQWLRRDRRKEPRSGQRVPYVIVYGAPGLPLIQLVRSPDVVMANPALRINSMYYITRAILPPLDRCFSLLGVDVNVWYSDLPRPSSSATTALAVEAAGTYGGATAAGMYTGGRNISIARYFTPSACVSCGAATTLPGQGGGLCVDCKTNPQLTICETCLGCRLQDVECISVDCPITFRRTQARRDLQLASQLQDVVAAVTDTSRRQ
ncbi:DNA polymerase zeta catalytic subunit-like 2, partial [Homarus americanus]